MPFTLCKAMYLSGVMKVPFSWGSCTSRSHPHCSHASGIHWRGSEVVVMPVSSQPAAGLPVWPNLIRFLDQGSHLVEKRLFIVGLPLASLCR